MPRMSSTEVMDDETTEPQSLAEYWEQRYAAADPVWSGRANPTIAEIVSTLSPGNALDLGCGEGGDVLWLAQQGWNARGVDLSSNAVARGMEAAQAQGVAERVRFEAADLAEWTTVERFDLVTTSFLHSWPFEIPRARILRAAASFVAPGGDLLVLAHAAPPPWARSEHSHGHVFPTPESELEALKLDPTVWTVLTAEVRDRQGTSPGGQTGLLRDTIVHARRVR